MFEHDDQLLRRIVAELRRPVAIDPSLDARVLNVIAGDAPLGAAAARRRRRLVLVGLAAAAVMAIALVARVWTRQPRQADGAAALQFVLVAPHAASVSLVGDFNDWDPSRSPMRTAHGVWATVVRLAPGRYRYAFLVNGVEWRADPGATRAQDDEFGASSVITVGGTGGGL